jgi:hypothetical protein
VVNQREVHADTHSFSNALRAALREDPDVVLIGEMRDLETIESALRIAETGHLDLRHAAHQLGRADHQPHRDVFPAHQQSQIRRQLSLVLEGHHVPDAAAQGSGHRALLAMEILVPNAAIRNLIREDKIHQIYSSHADRAGEVRHADLQPDRSPACTWPADHAADGSRDQLEPRRAAGHDQPRRRLTTALNRWRPPMRPGARVSTVKREVEANASFRYKGKSRTEGRLG